MVELLQHVPKKKAPHIASLRLPEFAALRRFKEDMRDEFEVLWTSAHELPAISRTVDEEETDD